MSKKKNSCIGCQINELYMQSIINWRPKNKDDQPPYPKECKGCGFDYEFIKYVEKK